MPWKPIGPLVSTVVQSLAVQRIHERDTMPLTLQQTAARLRAR